MPAPRQVSDRQWEMLIEFLEENRALAIGQLCNSGPLAKQSATTKWEELAVRLNSLGVGITKSGAKWRDYWNNQKYAVRKKASEMRVHALGTGGGPARKGILTALEERILGIIGKIAVHGNESVRIAFDPVTVNSSFFQPVSVPAPESAPSTSREWMPAHIPSEALSPLQQSDGAEDEFPPVYINARSSASSHHSRQPCAVASAAATATVVAPVPDAANHELASLPSVNESPGTLAVASPMPDTAPLPSIRTRRNRPARAVAGQSNVPQWALDIETRRVAAQEQQAQALQAISVQMQQQTALLQQHTALLQQQTALLQQMAANNVEAESVPH